MNQLTLPRFKSGETQIGYVRRVVLDGYTINTYQCRCMQIYNLHSIISELKKQGMEMTVKHQQAMDPSRGITPRFLVDVVFMTLDQRDLYKNKKKSA